MFVLARRYLSDRPVLVLLERLLLAFEDEDVANVVGDEPGHLIHLSQTGPPLGVAQFHQTIFDRARSYLTPLRHVIPQVPVLEGEQEPHLQRCALTIDADPALGATLYPSHLPAEALRMSIVDSNRVVENRSARRQRQLLEVVFGMVLDIALILTGVGDIGHLNESLIA